MKTSRSIQLSLISALLITSVSLAAPADDAKPLAEKGKAFLKAGDLDAAKKAFAQAAKTDPSNENYRRAHAILGRIITLRASLETETNLAKWSTSARAVRSFYLSNGLNNDALAISQQWNDKAKSTESAVLLAEVQLELNKNAEAEKVLLAVKPDQQNDELKRLLALAKARQNKPTEAKAHLAAAATPKADDYRALLTTAAIEARLSQNDQAIATLICGFEATPPSILPAVKSQIRNDADFASLAKLPAFTKALETASKVKRSECSGGKDCGSCPSRKAGQCKDDKSPEHKATSSSECKDTKEKN